MPELQNQRDDECDDASEKAVLRVPACDNCKTRKIKCDRNVPCSSCAASKISCRTTKRPPEKKQRVLLSKNYGEEIADVNRRLSELSTTIKALIETNKGIKSQPGHPSVHTLAPLPLHGQDSAHSEADAPFEGDTSFNSQSKTITEALGAALGGSPFATNNTPSSGTSAVQKLLEDVVASSRAQPVSSSDIGQYPELASQSLPPITSVLKLLRLAKDVPQRFFIEYPLWDAKIFAHTCQNVYFPTSEYSIATWIVVNVGLFYLFRDLDKHYLTQVGTTRQEAKAYVDLCTANALTCVQNLRLCLDATIDNVEGLALAASFAMELPKPSLAWKLIASAARLALDLGIHRQPVGLTGPVARRERIVFWFVYAIDKGLALNFGRTPNIHDYDMTVERPRIPDDFSGALAAHTVGWLDYAQLQGDIYEQLFCATAQRQPQNVRTSRAHSLAARCRDLQTRFMELDFGDNLVKEVIREAILSTDVVTYSMLTLIYRSIPAPPDAHPLTFAEECVDAARHALRLLTEAWKEIQPRDEDAWQLFVNWTILFVPFVPFIVVFGNTIARSSRQDLTLLEDAVRTIRGASQVAPAISKLRNACEKFCQIATAYLAQEAPESSQALPRDSSASTQYPPSTNADISMTGGIAYPSAADYQQLSDFPMQQGDWDGMLNEWDLGLGVENAREMTGWFEQYMQSGATGFR